MTTKTFTARVRFVDVRDITIEADSLEEANAKYALGDWASEDTVDFYSDKEIRPLREDSRND